jgi:mono/diheme cytochrome c family protein
MKQSVFAILLLLCLPLVPASAAAQGQAVQQHASRKADPQIERGKYLVRIAGCNDCHTPGYAASGGKVPESLWLVGDKLGWRGPWGTTYAPNLRLYMRDMSEAKWVQTAKRLETRPPMPWFVLHDMSEQDLRAIHRYVNALGPAGERAPVYLPPGQEPRTPYVQFPAAPPQ